MLPVRDQPESSWKTDCADGSGVCTGEAKGKTDRPAGGEMYPMRDRRQRVPQGSFPESRCACAGAGAFHCHAIPCGPGDVPEICDGVAIEPSGKRFLPDGTGTPPVEHDPLGDPLQ